MVSTIVLCIPLLSTLFLGRPIYAQKSPEDLLEEINRLSAPERQKRLEEGARKEGELVWYSTMNREDSLQLTRGFESRFPYIDIKMISGGAPKTFNRISSIQVKRNCRSSPTKNGVIEPTTWFKPTIS